MTPLFGRKGDVVKITEEMVSEIARSFDEEAMTAPRSKRRRCQNHRGCKEVFCNSDLDKSTTVWDLEVFPYIRKAIRKTI
jgi:hypothetical protein